MQAARRSFSPWRLATSLLISLGTGGLAGALTMDSMQDYQSLRQPPFAPPGILFPIVWTALFLLMGISAYRVYQRGGDLRKPALRVYAVQLFLNFCWPILFFGFQARLAAVIVLALLIGVVGVMIARFSRIDRLSALLQVPYALWLLFALYLNTAIILLNGIG